MRVKTEATRQAIIDAAIAVFRDKGYDRASMAEISARIGGSKATLYGYFTSKEALYAAAMLKATEAQRHYVLTRLAPAGADLATGLEAFGKALLALLTAPEVLAMIRTAMSEGTASTLGPALYAAGPRAMWTEVATMLAGFMASGALRHADPDLAALHFKGLLEAGIFEPALYGAPAYLGNDLATRLAVDTFLRAYAPPAAPAPPEASQN